MPTLEKSHSLRCQMAADAVESDTGVIRGCTVATAGVQATGKFVLLDAKGEVTTEEKFAKKRLPVFTDAKTLETLMKAAHAAGKRLKVREDHDDAVGARAGYADVFKVVKDANGERVAADIHLFRSYRNRDVVLETAKDTPEEIGLSIDFTPEFEITGDRALMRVLELHAVDIVDEGAITPGGLLLSARVDTAPKVETDKSPVESQPPDTMAATLEDIMTALTEMKTGHAALSKTVGELQAKLAAAPTPPATDPKVDEALKATGELKAQLQAVTGNLAQMKKERALLGFRGTDTERAKLSAATAEDIEKLNAEKKDYLSLVAARVESAKCKRSEAHLWVMKNHPTEYSAHLSAKGVVRANMAA